MSRMEPFARIKFWHCFPDSACLQGRAGAGAGGPAGGGVKGFDCTGRKAIPGFHIDDLDPLRGALRRKTNDTRGPTGRMKIMFEQVGPCTSFL